MVASTRSSAFLEAHFYKGGHRADPLAMDGRRPSWAPPADWVGFRDEISLTGDDVAIELAMFANGDSIVSWIGVYRHSPDQVFGDRSNHVGMGVWLLNSAPIEPALFIQGLRSLLAVYQKSDQSAFEVKGRAFLADYLGGWVSPYIALPSPLGGLSSGSGPALETAFYVVENESASRDSIIDDVILRLFFLTPNLRNATRALILLGGKASVSAAVSKGFKLAKSDRLMAELLRSLPAAFVTQMKQLATVRSELASSEERTEELDNTIDRLQIELATTKAQSDALEKQNAELRSSLEGDNDHQRHASLVDRLTEQTRLIAQISRDLGNLRSELRHDIRAELQNRRNLPSEQLQPTLSHAGSNGHRSRNPSPSTSNDERWNWLNIALIAFLVLLIVLGTLVTLWFWH